MIVVGYGINKFKDTYRFFNPKTRQIVESRDVKWGDWKTGEPKALTHKLILTETRISL